MRLKMRSNRMLLPMCVLELSMMFPVCFFSGRTGFSAAAWYKKRAAGGCLRPFEVTLFVATRLNATLRSTGRTKKVPKIKIGKSVGGGGGGIHKGRTTHLVVCVSRLFLTRHACRAWARSPHPGVQNPTGGPV
eukprot:TRINITY_DN14438_c0_g1_i1.p2 TRINITY_DN14438_c0_g1~~TRINITY_DN14438_c0_g1_i1.p2  ORF type:complete len:133 (-),score=1.90 TRINITY_DN14438_c0_g1_i1:6-404(-)